MLEAAVRQNGQFWLARMVLALYYQREGRPKYRMIPMANDLFRFDEIYYFRLKVEKDDNGDPTALVGLYDNGRSDRSPKGNTN